MKKWKLQDKLLTIKSVGVTIGIFIMLVSVFNGFKISLVYLILLLIIADLILLTLLEILEKKLK